MKKCNQERCENYPYQCNKCSRNPEAKLEDKFYDRGYIPICKYGYLDCVYDPAYLRHTWRPDYEGDCSDCLDSCCYDNEDK